MNVTRITLGIAFLSVASMAPTDGTAQAAQSRLSELLPGPYGDSAAAIVVGARTVGLPVVSLELLARQGVVKGTSPEVVVAALRAEARRLADARQALSVAGPAPTAGELRAGADALHRGVTLEAIAGLAREAPRDRSLEVPIFVLAGLVDRGVPVDDALAAVTARLRDGVGDRELGELPLYVTRLFARGLPTTDVVRTLLVMEHGLGDDLVPRNPGVQVQRVPARQN